MKQTYYFDPAHARWCVAAVESKKDGKRTLLVYRIAGEPAERLEGVTAYAPEFGGWVDEPRGVPLPPTPEPTPALILKPKLPDTEPPAPEKEEEEGFDPSALTVTEAKAEVDEMDDVDELNALYSSEKAGKNRSTLLAHIEDRIKSLGEDE